MNLHFTVVGICEGITNGVTEISLGTKLCKNVASFNDAKTGYISNSRMIIEEVKLRDGTTDSVVDSKYSHTLP